MTLMCAAVGCKSRMGLTENGQRISFHRFPKDDNVKNAWVNATGRQNWEPTRNTRICSKHFAEPCFHRTLQKVYLEKLSVPTLSVHNVPVHDDNMAEEPTLLSSNEKTLEVSKPVSTLKKTEESRPLSYVYKKKIKLAVPRLTLPHDAANTSTSQDSSSASGTEILPESSLIIASVYNYLQNEYNTLLLTTDSKCKLPAFLANILARTAAATGVSEQTISKVLELLNAVEKLDAPRKYTKRAKRKHDADEEEARQEVQEDATINADVEAEASQPEDCPMKEESNCTEDDEETDESQEEQLIEMKVEVEETQVEDRRSSADHLTSPPVVEVKVEPPDDDGGTTDPLRHLSPPPAEVKTELPDNVETPMASHCTVRWNPRVETRESYIRSVQDRLLRNTIPDCPVLKKCNSRVTKEISSAPQYNVRWTPQVETRGTYVERPQSKSPPNSAECPILLLRRDDSVTTMSSSAGFLRISCGPSLNNVKTAEFSDEDQQ